ncbi:MICOS complex subunit MIC60 [Paragonimus heterotremus]|uniref:MICOS complex subunit MIC60 n=1 Tax=Paragonimus heterotremus TaxID=100268 RepID=A0A8J4T556_9TREM|nr:MICOS complex subunit MIC60 [Paragonimus heterotremus]
MLLSQSDNFSNPPRKSRRWIRNLILITVFSTTSVAGLLYTSRYFRDLLVSYYPSTKPILEETERLIGGWFDGKPEHLTVPVDDSSSLRFLTEKTQNVQEATWTESDLENPPISDSSAGVDQPLEYRDPTHDLPTVEEVKQMVKERNEAVPAVKLSDISKVVTEATRVVKAANESLSSLESVTRNHIEALRNAIKLTESSDDGIFFSKGTSREKKWERVSKLAALKEKAQIKANTAVDEATRHLNVLRDTINHYKLNDAAPDMDALPEGIKAYGDLQYALSGSIFEVRKLQNELHMLMRYRDLVSKTHEILQKDLDAIHEQTSPDRTSKDGSPLNVGELNSLIVVAHNRIGQLQSMLADAEEKEKARLNSALEAQRRADEELITEYVKRELELERNKHELDLYNQTLAAREAAEHEHRLALARHSDHLMDMLRLSREKMEHQFTFRLREALTQEKVKFEAALSGWTKRMQAIEQVVDGRAELDRVAKETQALWIACEALASCLLSTTPTVMEQLGKPAANTTGPLKDFLEAIKDATSTDNHPLVLTILDCLPPEVSQNGIWIERGLKERFEKVYKVCRRVALVDEVGGSLYTYALSWLQSVLMLDVFVQKYLSHIPWLKTSIHEPLLAGDSELVGRPDELDTFSLLCAAKSALTMDSTSVAEEGYASAVADSDEGIEVAVRLLGQLRGQARVVASDWLHDARLYLETKQAAQTLLAYAAARGMSNFEKRL